MTEQTLSIETITPRTPLQEFWFYFKQNKGAVIGLTFILAVALISIFAPWIAPFDPIEQNRSALLLPPAWYEGGNSAYLMGTLVEIFFLALFMVRAFLFLQVSLLSYYLAF